MAFDQIEELKQKYTDKYVVVDRERPELARFRDTYGTVKTVNMSGRALVEFADYHVNIGWYDIDPMFLTVVDTPPAPKPKAAPEVKKPAAKGEAAATSEAKAVSKAKPAAKPATGGKPSTADILASLRGGGAAKAPAAKSDAPAAKPAPKPKTESSPAGGSAAPAKVDRSKMSVADMLAAARSGAAKGAAPPAEAEPQVEEAPAEEESAGEIASAAESVSPATAKASSGATVDKTSMTLDQMIAWCREHDSK